MTHQWVVRREALPELKLSGRLHDLILNIKVTGTENIIHIHIFGISSLMVSDFQYMVFTDSGWKVEIKNNFRFFFLLYQVALMGCNYPFML